MDANAKQIEHWSQVAGAKWVEFQESLDAQLRPWGERLLDAMSPPRGGHVLDVGCGTGDHLIATARRVGPEGSAVGVDVAPSMLDRARERVEQAALANVTLLQADAQVHAFAATSFDAITSRFGVMFFDDPPRAFANLRSATRPGGQLGFVCWQGLERNPWMAVPLAAARTVAPLPETPPGAPGPFGLDDEGLVRRVLAGAGWTDVALRDVSMLQRVGNAATLDGAVSFLMRIGPAAAALREFGRELRPRMEAALRDALAPYVTADGVVLDSAAWVVTARSRA